ncbi:MAG: pilus assembly protein TadG-related protein [Ancalomicrobiaceae bacterium]|nr:pilus assembly protein TadG-related protein [Ancalomicrobiaceae bacterium]
MYNTDRDYRPSRAQLIWLLAFALVAIGVVGYAVDTSNVHTAKDTLQSAIDKATIRLVRDIDSQSDAELKQNLAKVLEEQTFADDDITSLNVSVDRKKHRLTANATVRVESTITSLIGPDHVDVTVSSDTLAAN